MSSGPTAISIPSLIYRPNVGISADGLVTRLVYADGQTTAGIVIGRGVYATPTNEKPKILDSKERCEMCHFGRHCLILKGCLSSASTTKEEKFDISVALEQLNAHLTDTRRVTNFPRILLLLDLGLSHNYDTLDPIGRLGLDQRFEENWTTDRVNMLESVLLRKSDECSVGLQALWNLTMALPLSSDNDNLGGVGGCHPIIRIMYYMNDPSDGKCVLFPGKERLGNNYKYPNRDGFLLSCVDLAFGSDAQEVEYLVVQNISISAEDDRRMTLTESDTRELLNATSCPEIGPTARRAYADMIFRAPYELYPKEGSTLPVTNSGNARSYRTSDFFMLHLEYFLRVHIFLSMLFFRAIDRVRSYFNFVLNALTLRRYFRKPLGLMYSDQFGTVRVMSVIRSKYWDNREVEFAYGMFWRSLSGGSKYSNDPRKTKKLQRRDASNGVDLPSRSNCWAEDLKGWNRSSPAGWYTVRILSLIVAIFSYYGAYKHEPDFTYQLVSWVISLLVSMFTLDIYDIIKTFLLELTLARTWISIYLMCIYLQEFMDKPDKHRKKDLFRAAGLGSGRRTSQEERIMSKSELTSAILSRFRPHLVCLGIWVVLRFFTFPYVVSVITMDLLVIPLLLSK